MCRALTERNQKFLHGCIKMFIKHRDKPQKQKQKEEQAKNLPLRYASVMTHVCIVFVVVVSLKHFKAVSVVSPGGLGDSCIPPTQVTTRLKGMLDEWCT